MYDQIENSLPQKDIIKIIVSPSDDNIIVYSIKTEEYSRVNFYDLSKNEIITFYDIHTNIKKIVFSPNGNYLEISKMLLILRIKYGNILMSIF